MRDRRQILTHFVYLSSSVSCLFSSHCGGYCDSCTLKDSVLSLDTFERLCGGDAKSTKGYSSSVPSKIVHLVRNPFDNIVSRMHHGVMRRREFLNWTEDRLAPFNNTRQGLHSWCEYVDRIFWRKKGTMQPSTHVSFDVLSRAKKIPCHSEIFRYSQWHNHAMNLRDKLDLPMHVVFYEDYATNFNKTVTDLFNFLDLPVVNGPKDFVRGRTYQNSFFLESEQVAVREFIQNISIPQSWELLSRYFDGWISSS